MQILCVAKALRIMDAVAQSPKGMTRKEIARRVGVPAHTAFHLMNTLGSKGYLMRQEFGDYTLGLAIVDRARERACHAVGVSVPPPLYVPDPNVLPINDEIQSVTRALRILEIVGQAPDGAYAMEITEQSGILRTTTYRLAWMLESVEYLVRPKKPFLLGPRISAHAKQALAQLRQIEADGIYQ